MAKGYSPESIFGRPFDTVVNQQLNIRSAIVGKPSTGFRTDEEIQYLNGRSAFIKLTSSVNIEGSDEKAKQNVLFGGVLNNGNQRGGIDFDGNSNPAYGLTDSLGYRPMPGIDSIYVESKNTFGSLRIARVEFKCWTLEQLSDLEKLYLRPGFSVLLEWGNTMYFGNSTTDFVSTPQTLTDFLSNTANLTKKIIYDGIRDLKKQTYGNYDAMFGFIRNFQWSYRLDGGYDCMCDIVSIGELSEGMNVLLSLGQVDEALGDSKKSKPTLDKEAPEYNKSSLHRVIKAIRDVPTTAIQPIFDENEGVNPADPSYRPALNTLSLTDRIRNRILKFSQTTFFNYLKEVRQEPNSLEDLKVLDYKITTGDGSLRYITLRDLLALLNVTVVKTSKEKIYEFSLDREQSRFKTFDEHTSLDPGICVIPKPSKGYLGYSLNVKAFDLLNLSEFNNSILDIFLELDYILLNLDSLYEGQTVSSKSIATFIKNILGGIEENLGGINDLDYTFDEDAGKSFIIDRNLTPNRKDISQSIINITGLKSLVTNFNLTSKIPPNLANLVAISAQATSTDIGLEMTNLLKWNKGLTDRVFEKKFITAKENIEGNLESRIEDERGKLIEVAGQFNTLNDKQESTYASEVFNSAKTSHTFFCQSQIAKEPEEFGAAGIIPFELSVTMDGIGGLKITEAFTINRGILPSQYDNNTGFIITGLNHTVQNNRWETTIRATLIII